jgi:hypothetical protein
MTGGQKKPALEKFVGILDSKARAGDFRAGAGI